MAVYIIKDETTLEKKACKDIYDLEEKLRGMFSESVSDVIESLVCKLRRREYTGDEEAYLAVHIEEL